MHSMVNTSEIFTAQITDACIRLKIPFRMAPAGIKSVSMVKEMHWGQVVPARHYGSVDIFLEAIDKADQKGILVIDNSGRLDEACIGDLIVLEAKNSGFKAILVWGLHRDTADIIEIGFPVYSYGSYSSGPTRLDEVEQNALTSARFGEFQVSKADTVFADADGAVFVESKDLEQILEEAAAIRKKEKSQVKAVKQGVSLRQQFQFTDYLERRAGNPDYTFRKHLSGIAKSIEE